MHRPATSGHQIGLVLQVALGGSSHCVTLRSLQDKNALSSLLREMRQGEISATVSAVNHALGVNAVCPAYRDQLNSSLLQFLTQVVVVHRVYDHCSVDVQIGESVGGICHRRQQQSGVSPFEQDFGQGKRDSQKEVQVRFSSDHGIRQCAHEGHGFRGPTTESAPTKAGAVPELGSYLLDSLPRGAGHPALTVEGQ